MWFVYVFYIILFMYVLWQSTFGQSVLFGMYDLVKLFVIGAINER